MFLLIIFLLVTSNKGTRPLRGCFSLSRGCPLNGGFTVIDFIRVLEAILTGRQTRLEITVFSWKSDVKELSQNLKFERYSCARKRPVVF